MPWFHKYQNKIKIYLNKLKGIFLLMRVNNPSQEGINTIVQRVSAITGNVVWLSNFTKRTGPFNNVFHKFFTIYKHNYHKEQHV